MYSKEVRTFELLPLFKTLNFCGLWDDSQTLLSVKHIQSMIHISHIRRGNMNLERKTYK